MSKLLAALTILVFLSISSSSEAGNRFVFGSKVKISMTCQILGATDDEFMLSCPNPEATPVPPTIIHTRLGDFEKGANFTVIEKKCTVVIPEGDRVKMLCPIFDK